MPSDGLFICNTYIQAYRTTGPSQDHLMDWMAEWAIQSNSTMKLFFSKTKCIKCDFFMLTSSWNNFYVRNWLLYLPMYLLLRNNKDLSIQLTTLLFDSSILKRNFGIHQTIIIISVIPIHVLFKPKFELGVFNSQYLNPSS